MGKIVGLQFKKNTQPPKDDKKANDKKATQPPKDGTPKDEDKAE